MNNSDTKIFKNYKTIYNLYIIPMEVLSKFHFNQTYKLKIMFGNKVQRQPKGQSGMENPETLSTLSTKDTGQINQRKPKGQSGMENPETSATLETIKNIIQCIINIQYLLFVIMDFSEQCHIVGKA